MAINQQTFPTDTILPGLVEWFNSQPAQDRVIETNDVALFRVRLVEDPNGVISMVVGAAPYTAEGSKYLYEATFIWKGARGINLLATADSFFEISKFVATPEIVAEPLNIIPFNGYVLIPADVDDVPFLKMTFATNYHYSSYGDDMFTVGINGSGQPEVRTDNSYVDLSTTLVDVREVTGGDCWVAARKANGEVWAWGQNFSLFSGGYNNEAQQLDLGYYTGSTVAKQIAALQGALLILDQDGNVVRMGSNYFFDELGFPSGVEEMNVFWDQTQRFYQEGDEYESTFNQTACFFRHTNGDITVSACEMRDGSDINYNVSIANVPEFEGSVKQIIGTFTSAALVTSENYLIFWGDNNPASATGYVSDIFVDVDKVYVTRNDSWIVQKLNGQVYYFDGEQWQSMPWNIKHIAAADDAFAGVTTDNQLFYLGTSYGRSQTPEDLVVADIRQIHMGGRWTCALMNDGDLVWWGGGYPE